LLLLIPRSSTDDDVSEAVIDDILERRKRIFIVVEVDDCFVFVYDMVSINMSTHFGWCSSISNTIVLLSFCKTNQSRLIFLVPRGDHKSRHYSSAHRLCPFSWNQLIHIQDIRSHVSDFGPI